MFSSSTYIERRKALSGKLSGGVVLLLGNGESPINYHANAYRFRQDSTFLYYFGLDLPDLAAIVDVDSGQATLFGDDFTVDDIIWMGPQPSVKELAEKAGVHLTCPRRSLAETVQGYVGKGRKVHTLRPYRAEGYGELREIFGTVPDASVELIRAVVSMRDKKSAEEIAQIEYACDTAYKMHTTAMQMCREGVSEREIAGAMEGIALRRGWGTSFHSIVSQRGEVLHNHNYDGTLENGRLLLVDAGAEATSGYTSDNTRTIPVGGRFSGRQKEIYDIVLAANNHAFEISRPGVRYVDVHLAAARVILDGLQGLGLVKGPVDEAVAAGAHYLFMPHGLGHQMGLDVHDMENLGEQYVGYDDETRRSDDLATRACRMGRRLETGMVVTVEPGIYFVPELIAKWRAEGTCSEFVYFPKVEKYIGFGGIRLEDDMLITPSGNRLLGERRIPITTDEVESVVIKV